jgi:hypothetical protein
VSYFGALWHAGMTLSFLHLVVRYIMDYKREPRCSKEEENDLLSLQLQSRSSHWCFRMRVLDQAR